MRVQLGDLERDREYLNPIEFISREWFAAGISEKSADLTPPPPNSGADLTPIRYIDAEFWQC